MLREALARATPVLGPDQTVVLEFPQGDVHRQGIEQGRTAIEGAIAQVMGLAAVRLVVRSPADAAPGPEASAPESKRLDRQGDREERLRAYRAKDPSLDAAADAFDLELTE